MRQPSSKPLTDKQPILLCQDVARRWEFFENQILNPYVDARDEADAATTLNS